MENCPIDHSHDDVVTKLNNQKDFLPVEISANMDRFLEHTLTQETLNTLFHLLKKYDLASYEERQDRNKQLLSIMS
ncbi:hypothetical protein GCM10008983_04080 [Lentibacillus halophilus]|uniref:Group-specific protein n=1 Tax=Lentibacillus halophilus TaxID=295065 RepID=A0ABN0Z302_9BACI